MRIAICDTDNFASNNLKHRLYKYSNHYKLDFVVDIFSSGEELLANHNNYSVIFVEYNLSGIDGLKTSIILRQRNVHSKIIFTSINTDFILETFRVSPFRFLKKPINETALTKALDDCFSKADNHYLLWINNGINTFCFCTSDVLYLEADNKHCHIHLKDKTILCKKTMARVYELFPKPHFQKINRAFIVNLNIINKYSSENVELINGEKLHITRTYFKTFKQNYFNYTLPRTV